MRGKETENIVVGARNIPVLARADVIVAGAGFGGCAIAQALARRGLEVALLEPRIYPGWEVSGLLRPWIGAGALGKPPKIMAPWLRDSAVRSPGGHEVALLPGVMKRGLEDALLKAGVRLFYGSQPVGAVFSGNKLAGIVSAGKGGRYAILGRAVVDATEWGLVARLAGAGFRARTGFPALVAATRTLEFTGLAGGTREADLAGSAVASAGNGARLAGVHQGCLGTGHVLMEIEWPIGIPGAGLNGLMAVEIAGRKRTVEVVGALRKSRPGFRRAYFAGASWEMRMPSPLVSSSPLSRHRNLFALSSASADGPGPLLSFDPVQIALAGERMAEQVLIEARTGSIPRPAKCIARCGLPARGSTGNIRVGEPKIPARRAAMGWIHSPAESIPVLADTEVAVAGGGTGGAVAAPVSAQAGAHTVLLEMNPGLGGTGTLGGVNTYWFGNKFGFTAEVDRRYRAGGRKFGATRKETDRLDSLPEGGKWHVEGKMQALLDWSLEAGVSVYFRAMAVGTLVQSGTVRGLLVASPAGLSVVRCRVALDGTGDADIAAFAGARTTHGAARDGVPMYASLGPVASPGHPTNSFAGWVDFGDPADLTRAVLAGRRRFTWYDHGPYLAPRETRHIVGKYTVNLRDQLAFRRHPDTAYICHAERDIKGLTSADWALWGLKCGMISADIPWRALVPEKLDGLIAASKSFSSTHEGLAIPRMQADIQNIGGVAGLAAAMAVARGVSPRRLDVRALQRALVRRGVLPRAVLSRKTCPPPAPGSLRKLVHSLRGNELDYPEKHWQMHWSRPGAVPLLCDADSRLVLPLLEEAHASSRGARRLLVARLLAWHGSRAGNGTILNRISASLRRGALPALPGPRRKGHPAPDNAAMPETPRLIYTLGLTRDPRVIGVIRRIVRMFHPRPGEFRYPLPAYYLYTQMICLVAERLGSPEFIPILSALHAKPGLHGLVTRKFQPDIMEERMGYLEVAIGRALARCGSARGIRILAGYLVDARALLAYHAHSELASITGRDLGWTPARWSAWLRGKSSLKPRPWPGRSEQG